MTLVGVIGADAALVAADYRAPERLFAQLYQVAGRAGRADLPGEVLVQTRYPDHPLYHALVRHDFAGFAQAQLDERRAAGFPPAVHEAVLRAESADMKDALAFLARAAAQAPAAGEGVTVYDPVPMTLAKLADIDVFASERVHTGQGFVNEAAGVPNNQLTTQYWFPWYDDNLSMQSWVLVGKPQQIR